MSHTPHELTEEFPDMGDRISALKTRDGHFARLIEEYHEVNQAVHRVETRVEPASEDVEEELKRKRVRLKDEIFRLLSGDGSTAGEANGRDPDQMNEPGLRGRF